MDPEQSEHFFRLAKQGDGDAWGLLQSAWENGLRARFARRFSRIGAANVDEVLHDLVLDLWERLSTFHSAAECRAYLWLTFPLRLLNLRRNYSIEALRAQGFDVAQPSTCASRSDLDNVAAWTQQYCMNLDDLAHRILRAKLVGEPSVKELAPQLGISERTLKRRRQELFRELCAFIVRRRLDTDSGGGGDNFV